MKRIGYLLSVVLILTVLPGCSSEPRSVTMHEPGEYKGAKDPLLAQQKQQALIDRLKLVQTDR
jgi:hypothetical protein